MKKDEEKNADIKGGKDFIFGSQEIETRSDRVRALLAQKKQEILQGQQNDNEAVANLQSQLEQDPRFIEIKELLNNPDFDVVMQELQRYVDAFIAEGWSLNPQQKEHQIIEYRSGKMREEFLKIYDLSNAKWVVDRSYGEISEYSKKIEDNLAGRLSLELSGDHIFKHTFASVWYFSLQAKWSSYINGIELSIWDHATHMYKQVPSLDQLLTEVAKITLTPPTLWPQLFYKWEESFGYRGEQFEAFRIFAKIYSKYISDSGHQIYELISEGTYEEVLRIVQSIHEQLEPTRLLRAISSNTGATALNTRGIYNNTSTVNMGLSAIENLSRENSGFLASIEDQVRNLAKSVR